MSFSALTVVGDRKGRIGYGFGKANDVTEAIRKSLEKARSNLVTLSMKNGTIPHDVIGNYKSSSVLLKPACPGTGIIAGGAVRSVLELAGIQDVLSKCLGSRTPINVVRATITGLSELKTISSVAETRGKKYSEIR